MEPVRVIVLLKRRPGLSLDEFRHALEGAYRRFGLRLFGHLWLESRRHYFGSAQRDNGVAVAATGVAEPPRAFPYDAMLEIVYADLSALEEARRIAARPENLGSIKGIQAELFEISTAAASEMIQDDPLLASAAAGNVHTGEIVAMAPFAQSGGLGPLW